MLEAFTKNEINDAIENLIMKNQELNGFLFKNKKIGWQEFVSKLFLQLISVLSHLNIPIYLVRSRIYFPSNMESIVLEKIEEIMSKELRIKILKLNCEKVSNLEVNNRNFFSRFGKSELKYSERYLNNKRYFRIN